MTRDKYEFGWTDLNLVNHADTTNKLSSLFVTHLDLLDDLDEIKICTGYTIGEGEKMQHFSGSLPATIKEFGKMSASYEVLKGWKQDTRHIKTFDQLPTEA